MYFVKQWHRVGVVMSFLPLYTARGIERESRMSRMCLEITDECKCTCKVGSKREDFHNV